MMTEQFFYIILFCWCLIAISCFLVLFFMPAPYGRHFKQGYGPNVNGVLGWIAMECPAVIVFALIYFTGNCLRDVYSIAFLLMWEGHYIHRTFIYAFRRKNTLRPMPVSIVISGMAFNCINAYINSYWLNKLGDSCPTAWIMLPLFLLGTGLFLAGFLINLAADEKLLNLRRQGNFDYQIPEGGLYQFVSCPNYFGEIIEWFGFAIATLSPAAFAFALWTCANLIPRALSHNKWYRQKFPSYSKETKAIFPFLL